jgi:malonyl-CoA decarboxylase
MGAFRYHTAVSNEGRLDKAADPSTATKSSLGRLLRSLVPTSDAQSSDARVRAKAVIRLCHALLSERGEVSGARLAFELRNAYAALDPAAREVLFDYLVTEFSPDRGAVGRAADAFTQDPSPANLIQLQQVVEPARQELFRRFNMAEGGTTVLVNLRRELLKTLGAHPERAGIDADLSHLFRSWFNRGFLVLQRIEWRTSALVLERLIEYEAVHQIQGWGDLRRRLEADRRCYAFFHPALPDEPLIFIEVALASGIPARVQPLLDPTAAVADPSGADTAVFYSITNCQEGLRGVSFGNFLIKQVVEELSRDFPRLKTFTTLSPIPGFGEWMKRGEHPLNLEEQPTGIRKLLERLRGDRESDSVIGPGIQREVTRLCAYYLLFAKRGRAPLDPVARFHLANGASLERVNWMGDTSSAGLTRSLGMTANYVYRLADLERNHEGYAKQFKVSASRKISRLASEAAAFQSSR